MQAQIGAVGTALIPIEDKSIDADESPTVSPLRTSRVGLAGASLIAADLGNVDADLIGESCWMKLHSLQPPSEARCEVHVSQPVETGLLPLCPVDPIVHILYF
ncbi:hypothetical protein [Arthrobacter sp. MMS24-S77]